MDKKRTIELMKCERECVKRQFGPKCKRTVIPMEGCFGCDLVQDDKEIIEAYDLVIGILEDAVTKAEHSNHMKEETEAEIRDLIEEERLLDDRDGYIAGRGRE